MTKIEQKAISSPTTNLLQLISKGTLDSLTQVIATTLVRLGLALAVLALTPFVPLEEIGRFDLFVIGATLVQLAVTMGMDSGLAIVSQRKAARMRRWFLVVALIIVGILCATYWVILELLVLSNHSIAAQAGLLRMMVVYGTLLGIMILIFSWFRWQSKAQTASILLVMANVASFVFAALGFILFGTIFSFVTGLVLGGIGGVMSCLAYMVTHEGFSPRDLGEIIHRGLFRLIAIDLLKISLPYLISSVSLIMRRLIDRSYILTFGDATLIGAYAIVARIAEIIAFVFSSPSMGFAPILVSRYSEKTVKRLGRILYMGYVTAALPVILISVFALPLFFGKIESTEITMVMPIMVPIIAGTLFLGETSVAAYGYVIARKPALYTTLTILFAVFYAFGVIGLSYLGLGVSALGWSFLIATFVYSSAAVLWSEKLVPFGYPLKTIFIIKSIIFLIAGYTLLI